VDRVDRVGQVDRAGLVVSARADAPKACTVSRFGRSDVSGYAAPRP